MLRPYIEDSKMKSEGRTRHNMTIVGVSAASDAAIPSKAAMAYCLGNGFNVVRDCFTLPLAGSFAPIHVNSRTQRIRGNLLRIATLLTLLVMKIKRLLGLALNI